MSFSTYLLDIRSSLQDDDDDDADVDGGDVDLRLARLEHLMERRPLLLSSVLLRQNPHNVVEWLKRVSSGARAHAHLPCRSAGRRSVYFFVIVFRCGLLFVAILFCFAPTLAQGVARFFFFARTCLFFPILCVYFRHACLCRYSRMRCTSCLVAVAVRWSCTRLPMTCER